MNAQIRPVRSSRALVAIAQPPASTRPWSTLRLMRTMRLVLWILNVTLLVIALQTVATLRGGLHEVSSHLEPSLVAAETLQSSLAAMDADAANAMTRGPLTQALAKDTFDEHRTESYRTLLSAAESASDRDEERALLASLAIDLGSYERLTQEASDLQERGAAQAIGRYQEAAQWLDGKLLPQAAELETLYSRELERDYGAESFRMAGARASAVLLFALELLVFFLAQIFLSRRTRRVLHLPLLFATLALVLSTLRIGSEVARARQSFRLAEQNVTSSIQAIGHARGEAARAEDLRSRLLLNSKHGADSQQAFWEHVSKVGDNATSFTTDEVITALRQGRHIDGVTGLLPDAVETDLGSSRGREASLRALGLWLQYGERGKRSGRSVSIDRDTSASSLRSLYLQFSEAAATALTTDESAFREEIEHGTDALRGTEAEIVAASVLLAVLSYLGFAPRIREYR